jgi:hypothetical protein
MAEPLKPPGAAPDERYRWLWALVVALALAALAVSLTLRLRAGRRLDVGLLTPLGILLLGVAGLLAPRRRALRYALMIASLVVVAVSFVALLG